MQPLIIFGARPRTTTTGKGEFYCPNCSGDEGQQRRYELKKSRNFFTLYFVPLVPLGAGEEYVECQYCGMVFKLDVLDIKFKVKRRVLPLAQQLNTLKQRLEDGLPIEYAVADLTAAGLDRDVAMKNVRQAIGTQFQQCPQCNLRYAPGVERCAEDETPLGTTL
ncbi:MAG: zinc ribbon domain-containing protein [Chloroflexota bacterium]